MEVGTDQVLIEMLQVLLLSSVVTMPPSWNQPTSSGPSGQSAAAKTGSEAAAPRSQAARGECLLSCLLSCSRVFPRAEQISPLRWSRSLTPLRRRRQQRRKTYRRTVRTQIARWILEEPSVSMATRSLLQRDGRTRGPLEKLAAWTFDGFLKWRDVGCRRTYKGRSP